MLRSVRSLIGFAAGSVGVLAGPASATWSILIVDTRTGEIGVASATCLTGLDLRELTPVLIAGVGAVTAQSAGDTNARNRTLIRNRLLEGVPLAGILDELGVTDAAHQSRQYGMVDASGDALTFTGTGDGPWAGGVTGRAGDLVYAVQGNVLSGPNVVEDAAQAIVTTPGDLPERLMAAMLAARHAGGDGRCSCNPGNPQACGSPPPTPFKSAHVGYALVARAGDVDASRGLFAEPPRPGFYASTDLDRDGLPDLVVSSLNQTYLTAFLNRTTPGDDQLLVAVAQTIELGIAGVRDLRACDATGDGTDDLVFLGTNPPGLTVLPGDGAGGFGAARTLALPTGATRLRTLAPEPGAGALLVVTNAGAGTVGVYSGDGDAPVLTGETAIAGSPTGLAFADIDGDGLDDIFVTLADEGRFVVLGNPGSASPFAELAGGATGEQPVDVDAGDLDGDGDADAVVANDAGRSLSVLFNDGGAFVAGQTLALAGDARGVALGSVAGDPAPDIVSFAAGTESIGVFANDGHGGFGLVHTNRAGPGEASILLADLNADGLDDIVSGSLQTRLALMQNLGGGVYPPLAGFANGDYFLALNVPDAIATDEDPVDQLAGMFADWRSTLEGRIDAVRTEIVAPSRVVEGAAYTARIVARDWRGNALSPAVIAALAEPIRGTGSVLGVRTPEPGVVEIDLLASAQSGEDAFRVALDDGSGAVVLMPGVSARVVVSIADFDGSGVRNFFDVFAFVGAYNAGDPAADLDRDGDRDADDLASFVTLFLSP